MTVKLLYRSPFGGELLQDGASLVAGQWIRVCDTSACLEVLARDDRVFTRLSGNPDRILDWDRDEWEQHKADVKAGKYDEI